MGIYNIKTYDEVYTEAYNKAIFDMLKSYDVECVDDLIKNIRNKAIKDCIEIAEEWKQYPLSKEFKKLINENDSIGFNDDDIFLLSIEEYEKYKDNIPHINTWWWLRSPGLRSRNAAGVHSDGSVSEGGYYVCGSEGVRPALKYSSLKSEIFESKEADCFMWNEIKWKIIDKENEIAISCIPISFDKFDDDNNDYENSYIREYLRKEVIM